MRVPKFKTSTASLELPVCFNGKGTQLCQVESDILKVPGFRCRVLNFYEGAPYCGLTGDLLRVLNKPYGSVDFFPTELLVYRHQIGECLTKYQDVSAFVYKTTTTEILISDGRKVPIEDTLACLDFQTFVYGLSRMAPNEELFETYRALAKASPLRDLETSDLLYSDYMKHVVAEEYCAVHGFKKEGE